MQEFPMAGKAVDESFKLEELRIRKLVERRQLAGAANNTKWNKLISHMRNRGAWLPAYRSKSVDGFVSGWSSEWFFHLPFPFVGVEWFDISLHQHKRIGELVKDEVIDHSDWILPLLAGIGFKHEAEDDAVRIWGYLPKCYDHFPPTSKGHDAFRY